MSTFRDQEKNKEKDEISEQTYRDAAERMGIAKAKLLLNQPFYGVLLSMTDFIPEASIPTMATDGSKVYYNPKYTMELTEKEVFGVLLHEISHCIYLHCTSKRRLNRENHKWNVACDFAINLEIKNMGYTLPHNTLLDEKYREHNAEMIYDALSRDVSNMQTLDMHIENSDAGDWDDMETKIVSAYEATRNGRDQGNLPAGMKRWIDKLRNNKVKWERIFQRYVGQALAKDDYSYARVNRRMVGQDIYLPDLRNYIIGRVVVGIDTSGSMSQNCLAQFGAEVSKIAHLVEDLTVMTCDAEVQEVIKVRKFEEFIKNMKLQFKGGGGTDFAPMFNMIKEKKWQPELFILLTDTYGSWGQWADKKPNYPVLIVSTEESGKAPFGTIVYMPNDKKDPW